MAKHNCRILVLGATSAIAQEVMREYAENRDCQFILVGRDNAKLSAISADIEARGAVVSKTLTGDFVDTQFHSQIIDETNKVWDRTDLALLSWGYLGNDELAQQDYNEAKRIMVVNGTSYISMLIALSNYFENQKSGTIATITSVAGDRGRYSNYTYGSAKAMVSNYLSGLRARLHRSGVSVIDIRPGPIATPMTSHLPKGPLMAESASAGRSIYRSLRRNQAIIYVPWFWRWIMMVVKALPTTVFKRLKF